MDYSISFLLKISVSLWLFFTLNMLWMPIDLPSTKIVQNRPSSWHLTQLNTPHNDSWIKTITDRNLWGQTDASNPVEAATTAASTPLPSWKILGADLHDHQSEIVLQVEGKPPKFLLVGDKLPGGAVITQIFEDHIHILIQGKRATFYFPYEEKLM